MKLEEARQILDNAGFLLEMDDDYYFSSSDEIDEIEAYEKSKKNWNKTIANKQSDAKRLAPSIKKLLNEKGWRAQFYQKEWVGGPCFYVRGMLTSTCKFYARLDFITEPLPTFGSDSKITIDEDGVFVRTRKINSNSNLGKTCPKDIQKGYNKFLSDLKDILNSIGG